MNRLSKTDSTVDYQAIKKLIDKKRHAELKAALAKPKAVFELQEVGISSFLTLATEAKDAEAIRILLASGADPNDTRTDVLPLYQAVESQAVDCVVELLKAKKKPKLNELTEEGDTPLICAIRQKSVDICRLLLDSKADPNQDDATGDAPLWHAVEVGNVEILKLLLKAGGLVSCANSPNRGQEEIVIVAARKGRADLVDALSGYGSKYYVNEAKLILEMGKLLDVNQFEKIGQAIWDHENEKVKKLLDKGISPNVCDRQGVTPLMVAAQRGNLDLIHLIIQRGGQVEWVTPWGESALTYAALHGQGKAYDFLKVVTPKQTHRRAAKIKAEMMKHGKWIE